LTGVFATKAANPAGGNGLLYGNPGQMGVQLIAILAAIAISVVGTVVFMLLLKATIGVKAGVREQLTGLDLSEHGEEAYFGDVGGTAAPGSSLGEGVIVSTAPASGMKKAMAS
jgi:Amt family ammonium transporter